MVAKATTLHTAIITRTEAHSTRNNSNSGRTTKQTLAVVTERAETDRTEKGVKTRGRGQTRIHPSIGIRLRPLRFRRLALRHNAGTADDPIPARSRQWLLLLVSSRMARRGQSLPLQILLLLRFWVRARCLPNQTAHQLCLLASRVDRALRTESRRTTKIDTTVGTTGMTIRWSRRCLKRPLRFRHCRSEKNAIFRERLHGNLLHNNATKLPLFLPISLRPLRIPPVDS